MIDLAAMCSCGVLSVMTDVMADLLNRDHHAHQTDLKGGELMTSTKYGDHRVHTETQKIEMIEVVAQMTETETSGLSIFILVVQETVRF